jgi:hypothetical protein
MLLDSRKTTRVVVSVTLIQKSVAVEVDRERVEPLTSCIPIMKPYAVLE